MMRWQQKQKGVLSGFDNEKDKDGADEKNTSRETKAAARELWCVLLECALFHLVLIIQCCSAHLIEWSRLTAHNILLIYGTTTHHYQSPKTNNISYQLGELTKMSISWLPKDASGKSWTADRGDMDRIHSEISRDKKQELWKWWKSDLYFYIECFLSSRWKTGGKHAERDWTHCRGSWEYSAAFPDGQGRD